MSLATLPRMQKRLLTWSALVDTVPNEELKQDLLNALEIYKATLVRCWKQGNVKEEDSRELNDIERRIVSLHELARFAGAGASIAEHTE